jgi:hypothetical protein
MEKEDFDWFAQNPYNQYQCEFCGQIDKGHDDPRDVITSDRCFRCGGPWKIKDGTKLRLPREKWYETNKSE